MGLGANKILQEKFHKLILSKCSSLGLKEIKVPFGEELGVGFLWSDSGMLQDPMSLKPHLELGDIHVKGTHLIESLMKELFLESQSFLNQNMLCQTSCRAGEEGLFCQYARE